MGTIVDTKDRYQVIPRTLCFVFNHGKILLIEYSNKKGAMKGFLNCPGGHIEKGEGAVDNAEKEIFEETGLKVKDTKLKGVIHITNFFGKNVILFVTTSVAVKTEVVEGDEGKLHWVDLNELDTLNLIDDVKVILEKIRSSTDDDIFTAKSVFDDNGKLLKMEFGS